ncbi:MAG: hypothetical protein LBR60_05730 [Fibrobacter sp.]|jgi:hypothetical protein|nr:hypothetical protein [Fibrobacter sp.]
MDSVIEITKNTYTVIRSHISFCHRERETRAAIKDTLSFSDLIRESSEEQYRVRMATGYALVMTNPACKTFFVCDDTYYLFAIPEKLGSNFLSLSAILNAPRQIFRLEAAPICRGALESSGSCILHF